MNAVHFGAGNIGRGFLGQLYFETGYRTTFVDVVPDVVCGLQERGEYPVRVVEETCETILVRNVTAVSALDQASVAEVLAKADLASTAVGVGVLPRIAPALAAGIALRAKAGSGPLNIIVCENLINAGPYLREEVRKHLAPEHHAWLDENVGFVEASIGRMVPVMTDAQKAEDPLLVCVEPYCELPVDANGFKGAIPALNHMKPSGSFGAYVERKLFVHNAGHATTAYLGWLKGHEYIWQAIEDPAIRERADAAMAESCEGLARKHGVDLADLQAHWADLVHRFRNRALGDQVARVAKDPMRKLGANDRLIGAATMCMGQGICPAGLAFAAAAALRYDNPDDPAAVEVRRIVLEQGFKAALEQFSGLAPDSELTGLIGRASEELDHWLR